jgi:hypothetical protein
MADKVLSFKIDIEGVSTESQELAKLEIQLKNIKKEKQELLKLSSKGFASKEQQQQLAAYNKEIARQEAALKTLKRVVDTASDSLARKKAVLIELTTKSDKASQSIRDAMAPAIKKLNDEIKNSEQARGVFTRNVGNYPQLFAAIPGPVGQAASSIQGVVEKLKLFGPVGTLIGGGLLAISAPLVAFFTKSEQGVELLERKVSGFKGAMSVLTGELIGMGEKMVDVFDKPEKKIKTFWTTVMTMFGPAWTTVGLKMDNASAAMEKYTGEMQLLEDLERSMIVPRAEANLQIKQARLDYADANKTIEERIDALSRALAMENKTADQEIANQNKKVLLIAIANDELKAAGKLRDSDEKKLQEAIARSIELETESVGRQVRAANTLRTAKKELLAESVKDKKEASDAELKIAKEQHDQELLAEKEATAFIEEQIKLMDAKKETEWQQGLDLSRALFDQNKKDAKAKWDLEQDQAKKEINLTEDKEKRKQEIEKAIIATTQKAADTYFQVQMDRSNAAMTAELANENLTETQKIAIKKKYMKEQQKIQIALINGALGIVSSLSGPPIYKWIEVAAVVAATALQIAAIKAQKFAKGGKISQGVPVDTGTKDDTLIAVNKTETVLTQEHVRQLGGSATMRRIKVPGYEMGGYIGQQAPQIPAQGLDIAALAGMINSIEVRLDMHKVRKATGELNTTLSTQRI